MKKNKANKFLFNYIKAYKFQFIVGFLLTICSQVLVLYNIKILGNTIDLIKEQANNTDIKFNLLLLLIITIISGIFLAIQRWLITSASRFIEYDIRVDFLKFLQNVSPKFFIENRTGDIMSRITNDLSKVREMIGAGGLHLARTGLSIIITIFFMLSINIKLTLFALIPLFIVPFLTAGYINKINDGWEKVQKQLAEINSSVEETFAGIDVIKSFGIENVRIINFSKTADSYLKINLKQARLVAILFPMLIAVASLGMIIMVFMGGQAVVNNTLTLGKFVSLMSYIAALSWPLMGFGWVMNMIQMGKASNKRIYEIMKSSFIESKGNKDFKSGDLKLINLNFRYSNSRPKALSNISMDIKKGSLVVFAGTVGSGKTTAAHLFSYGLEVPKQSLFIGDIDITEIEKSKLRKAIGIVPQETFLFSDTIKNNVTFNNKLISNKQFEEALNISRFNKDLENIPGGINCVLGEKGINLSGGQRQRLAIARVIVHNPEILILDDCLSAVDANTEQEILSGLKKFFIGRTVILISHRFSAIKDADTIFVFDNGKIFERGSHTELISKKSLYKSLYIEQKLKAEIIKEK